MKLQQHTYRGVIRVSVYVNNRPIGNLQRAVGGVGWSWRLASWLSFRGGGLKKQEAIQKILQAHKAKLKAKRKLQKNPVCRCREPKRHRDCLYCGFGGPCTHVCGVCKEQGIDGPVIPGTSRQVCKLHKLVKQPSA